MERLFRGVAISILLWRIDLFIDDALCREIFMEMIGIFLLAYWSRSIFVNDSAGDSSSGRNEVSVDAVVERGVEEPND